MVYWANAGLFLGVVIGDIRVDSEEGGRDAEAEGDVLGLELARLLELSRLRVGSDLTNSVPFSRIAGGGAPGP